jgi:hypothetical protein
MYRLLTESAAWLGYSGFPVHLTCRDLYERRPEGPLRFAMQMQESDMSPSYPGPPGRSLTTFQGYQVNGHFLKGWLDAWSERLLEVGRLRFGRQCRNLRVVYSELRFEGWGGSVMQVYSHGVCHNGRDRLFPCEIVIAIEVDFEETALGKVYSHVDYSWLTVLGVTYHLRWRRPKQRNPTINNGVWHHRRWLEVTLWGRFDPILFQVSFQELPRLPAGSVRF